MKGVQKLFLKKSGLRIDPETLTIEGDDVTYVNFGGSAKVRLIAFFKDKKTDERRVLYASVLTPGGKQTMPRSKFEKEFAEQCAVEIEEIPF